MKNVRYEQYSELMGEVPFVLNSNLTRSPICYSDKQNWHENIEIQLCVDGVGSVLIDGKQYDFNKNDIAVINSNSIHYTYSNTSVTYSCIIVGTDFCKRIGLDYNRVSFYPIVQNPSITKIFLQICDIYNGTFPFRIAKLNHLLIELLLLLAEGYSKTNKTSFTEKKEVKIIKDVLIYIRERFNQKITLDEIAKHVLVDKYTLCKIFKKTTGETIFSNLNAYRCTKAIEYIKEGKSISESAYMCGFENNSFFSKTFKKYKGVSPSKFIISN